MCAGKGGERDLDSCYVCFVIVYCYYRLVVGTYCGVELENEAVDFSNDCYTAF